MIRKAIERGARTVILDLEDAVEGSVKPRARTLTSEALRTTDWGSVTRIVRVNGVAELPELLEDLKALQPVLSEIDMIILPKVESADDVHSFEALLLGSGDVDVLPSLIPTIESAAGVWNARQIAAASGSVHTLLFGLADLSAELGITPTAEGQELLTARSMVVLACAAAGITKPWNGPHLNIDDDAGLRVAADNAHLLGFHGMVTIHPKQLSIVTNAFAPTTAEIAWASSVIEAFTRASAQGSGAVRLSDGTFIDQPIATRAEAILGRAQES
ncbi:hypothetical protein AR539_09100 [Arthrobacter sp. EPSL27]|nr:hypothetical protein AR539_09100 [Arthrobacter sp. EPSL27]